MPFPFSEICTLLQRLEDIETRNPPFLKDAKYARIKDVVESWIKSHRRALNDLSVDGTSAFLSALLPEWRTDRVYGIQTPSLYRILCRTLQLGVSQRKELERYRQPGNGDLALCLENVLTLGGTQATPIVTLEEVDDMFDRLAGSCSFSGPEIRNQVPSGSSEARDQLLGNILKRLRPQEGKWLARMVLKNFSPVSIDENLVLKNFHFLLPDLLRFQRDFKAAAMLLKGDLHEYPDRPDPRSEKLLRRQAAQRLRPSIGTKISRPHFHKARSIDSCIKMVGQQSWVLERKYDGEYCEIHVDLRKSPNPSECIKIFSKSGKDSTQDRAGVQQTIIDALRLGEKGCRFKKQAILLGELVVFSDKTNEILPFEKIRKHVSRSGRFIGTDDDSQAHPHEHLAIVFFDLLLLDDEVVMNKPVEERRMWLREAFRKIRGRALSAEWKIIDFSGSKRARDGLVQQFAASNAKRCEGLVLKPCGVPYFSLESTTAYHHSFIKLKKDSINGMGDEADFAVIGASYNAQQAAISGHPNIKWTTFHLGCLVNAEEVRRADAKPIFQYVGAIEQEKCIPRPILQTMNQIAVFSARPYIQGDSAAGFDIRSTQPLKMDVVFLKPFVFEVLGSGFEQPSNTNFLMLRHPRVKKLHEDRTWRDCITFQELQEQGRKSRAAPDDSESQETRRWIHKLESSCRKKFEREKSNTPRSSTAKTSTPGGSVASISQRISPIKPHVMRIAAATPTPSSTAGMEAQSVSPVHRAAVHQRQSSCSKRKSDEVEIIPLLKSVKRQRTERPNQTRGEPPPVLKEITNSADTPATRQSTRTSKHSRALSDITNKLISLVRPRSIQPLPTTREDSISACESSRCPFSSAVVYLTPCIARTLYITEDLLSTHNISTSPCLAHWDRASFTHPPLTETVSESQSHPGLRKIVLVERKRPAAVRDTVERILALGNGMFKERVEVWDWRVLEKCVGHGRSADCLKECFLGATIFDDTRKRAVFVGDRAWEEMER